MRFFRAVVLTMAGLVMSGDDGFGAAPTSFDRPGTLRLIEAWNTPVPPRRLIGNIHFVGAMGVSSFLITTPEGHILLDTGLPTTLPRIERGVEELGFKLTDIKLILSSHAHFDHVGGHAALKRLTGAAVVASAEDARVLESGGAADFIPFPKDLAAYEAVKVDRIVADGETVTLGGVALTANITPGHTRGATTWTMDVTEAGRIYRVVFFSSASINSGTRLTGPNASYPEIENDLATTLAKFKQMRCDIFLAPHGGQFALAEKFARLDAGESPAAVFVDPEGWRQLIAAAEKAFLDQLKTERAEPTISGTP
jgi:metallo-beta-lactamase class B